MGVLQIPAAPPEATANTPGAAPNWPPKFTMSGEHVGVRALSVVPPTGATTNKQPCNWDSNSWSNGAPGTALGYTWNRATHIGYNTGYHSDCGVDDDAKLGWILGLESGYWDTNNSTFGPEFYLEMYVAGGASYLRPYMIRGIDCEGSPAVPAWFHMFDIGASNQGQMVITGGGGNLMVLYTSQLHLQMPNVLVYGDLAIGTTTPYHTANWNNLTMVGTTGTAIKMVGGSQSALIEMVASGFYFGSFEANLPVSILMGGFVGASLDGRKNFTLGSGAAGATALECLVLPNTATAPTASADKAHLYCGDLSAGNATLGIWTETAVAADAARASTHSIKMLVNGTAYRFLISNAA
jgi:hypothetical protein